MYPFQYHLCLLYSGFVTYAVMKIVRKHQLKKGLLLKPVPSESKIL